MIHKPAAKKNCLVISIIAQRAEKLLVCYHTEYASACSAPSNVFFLSPVTETPQVFLTLFDIILQDIEHSRAFLIFRYIFQK